MKYRLKNVQYTNTNVLVELSNKHTFHLDIDPYLVVSETPESLKIDVSKSLKYNVFPSVDAANISKLIPTDSVIVLRGDFGIPFAYNFDGKFTSIIVKDLYPEPIYT